MTIPQKWFLREKHKNLSNIFQISNTLTLLQFVLHAGCTAEAHLPLLLQRLVRGDGGAEVEADKGEDHGNLHTQRVSDNP